MADPEAPDGINLTTLQHLKPKRSSDGFSRVLALTVVAHPDASMIGARALLHQLVLSGEVAVSRTEPTFSVGSDPGTAVIAEPHVSRKPMMLRHTKAGYMVDVSATTTPVDLDGQRISGQVIVHGPAIDEGVVIELCERVALLLHWHVRVDAPAVPGLVGDSTAIEQLRQEIVRVADAMVPILILGETGTGKERVARALHQSGPRAKQPFVPVNMATLPVSMAASQLFGYVKGAFSGADHDHRGFFQQAHGGTLFLDEIGETSAEDQAMLLRVLEDSVVQPLGASSAHAVDVRVIAATDLDLQSAVASGEFRAPLMHRLAAYQIATPPLRSRRDDISRLLYHFLREEIAALGDDDPLVRQDHQAPMWLSTGLMRRLIRYEWPGNVRELRNVARRLALLGRGRAEIVPDEGLSAMLAGTETRPAISLAAPVPRQSSDLSDDELIAALARNQWKTSQTARELGMSKATLYQLMERCPRVRTAKELDAEEIEAWRQKTGGNIAKMAAGLQVSERGLKLRMTDLGI